MLGLLCHRDTLLTCINLSARILRSFSARLLSICSAYAVLWSHSSPGAGLCICLFWTWLLCAHSGPYESSLPSSILTKSKCLFFLISGTFLQLSVCTCKWFWSSWANYQRELGAQNQNPKNTFLPYPLSLIVSYIPFESSAWNQGKIMYTALIKLPAKNFLHFFFKYYKALNKFGDTERNGIKVFAAEQCAVPNLLAVGKPAVILCNCEWLG